MQRLERKREGVAATECALVLPLVIGVVLFTVEVCTVLFLKETITLAAYEGARVGILRGGTNTDVETRVKQLLDERGVVYTNPVTISEGGFENAQELEHVTTTVTVPAAGNLPFGRFFTTLEVSAEVTMRKEFENPNFD